MKTSLLVVLAAAVGLLVWSKRSQAISADIVAVAQPDNSSSMMGSVFDMINNGIKDVTIGPRGIRNNNPGNIRIGTANWQGMAADQTDGDFVQFISPAYGIRAINKILDSYQRRGIVTVRDIISTWAPPSENDTQAYIDAVASGMGIPADAAVLDTMRTALIAEIIRHENGQQPYDLAVINSGVQLA